MRIFCGILLYLIKIASLFLGGWFLTQSARRLLTDRAGRVCLVSRWILFLIALQIPSWIGDENVLYMLPFFLGAFLLCYEGAFLAKLVVGLTFYTLLTPLCMISDSIDWKYYEITKTLIKVGAAALIWLLVRKMTKADRPLDLSSRIWMLCGLLLLAPIFSILSFSIWTSFGSITDDGQLRIAYTILPFTIFSAAAVLYALTVLSRQEALEKEHRLAGMRELYYESLQRQETQVRTLRHDLRNHLAVLQGLLENGDTARANAYLAELCDSPALHGVRRVCENETANVVLSSKLEIMKEKGLTADFLISLPATLPISNVDLCSLLGNALDNAIEAAEKEADKKISLRMRADRGLFMLRVENACTKMPEQKDGVFVTAKHDKTAHGFGLTGMREIVRRYGGTLEAGAENGRFELVVCLPLSDAELATEQ